MCGTERERQTPDDLGLGGWCHSVPSASVCQLPSFVTSISIAVVGEVTTVIVIAITLVAIECFEIDFIQNVSPMPPSSKEG
jgi:hypothetical protein